jgi:hypothetical protein
MLTFKQTKLKELEEKFGGLLSHRYPNLQKDLAAFLSSTIDEATEEVLKVFTYKSDDDGRYYTSKHGDCDVTFEVDELGGVKE